MASAERLIAIRHFCLNNKSTAEINVPACPIPTHQTKFVISQAHPTVLLSPQVPIPVEMVYMIHPTPHKKAVKAIPKTIHHCLFAAPSTGAATSTVTSWYDLSPVTRGFLIGAS